MDAASRHALAAARERLQEHADNPAGLLDKARERLIGQPKGASGDDLLALSDELFAVARVLGGEPALRRALSDPSAKPEARAGLTRRLFDGKVSEVALDLLETVARQRWSRPMDLVEATETLGTDAALAAGEARDELEGVEDELFRFGRIVAGDPELARVLGDRTAPAEGKAKLLDQLLDRRASPVTTTLLRNVLTTGAVGNPEVTIELLSEAASRRRGQSLAHVISAVELTEEQERRLTDVLGRIYGRAIGLQVTIDPYIAGGLVIRVGDEVIDGSIAARLEDARRRLAG